MYHCLMNNYIVMVIQCTTNSFLVIDYCNLVNFALTVRLQRWRDLVVST